jgi:glucose-1-phosphate thymidylyltransferase
VALILGDNVFYGDGLIDRLKSTSKRVGATIFGYHVATPQDFGVIEFDKFGRVISLEEKPKLPKSNYIVPGLYFYDNEVISIAKKLLPSERGELEITDINNIYLKKKKLNVELLGRGITWLDAGTHQGLLSAANYISAIQSRQGQYIACIEEIAYRQGFINKQQLLRLAEPIMENDYGKYLYQVAEGKFL